MDLQDALRTHFSHEEFRGGQEAVIRALLDGESALALFPTGAGKSLCYQLPAVLLEGTALVISPLIALMKDQVDALRARGIAAARLDSSLTAQETQRVYADLRAGDAQAALRRAGTAFRRSVSRSAAAGEDLAPRDRRGALHLRVGSQFPPGIPAPRRVAEELALRPVLALTATATPEVAGDICRAFGIATERHVQTSFRRKNLHLRITPCAAEERWSVLTKRLASPKVRPAVVYVTFQKTAEEVAAHLAAAGLAAQAYHAGMKSEEREKVQEAFMRGESEIIVATIAFRHGHR
jgi:ATP-dependent DNA helicase RecQ